MTDRLLDELAASQSLVIGMTRLFADDDHRVGAWTLRDIVAHLAASERECFAPRIRAMVAGEKPRFEWYSNDERDFDGLTLEAVLGDWTETRAGLIDFVGGVTAEARQRAGVHATYGEISVDDYLRIALEHDRDHLGALERLAGELAR
ncbi:MAG: DinB family protein [Candidatus Dormibacteraceae bacterium]